MPSQSLAEALLALSLDTNGDPWTWSLWQHRTGLDLSPLSKSSNHPEHWTFSIVDCVHSFAINFQALPDDKRIEYMRNLDDHNAVGHKTWKDFVSHGWHGPWGANNAVEDILRQNKASPYEVMQRFKATQVSPSRALVTFHYTHCYVASRPGNISNQHVL